MSALLEIKDLSIGYKTDTSYVYAVNGVDLTLEKGECLGMVGETEVGISRDGTGRLYVSMFLTWQEVDYAILIDAEEFFATTEAQSAGGGPEGRNGRKHSCFPIL